MTLSWQHSPKNAVLWCLENHSYLLKRNKTEWVSCNRFRGHVIRARSHFWSITAFLNISRPGCDIPGMPLRKQINGFTLNPSGILFSNTIKLSYSAQSETLNTQPGIDLCFIKGKSNRRALEWERREAEFSSIRSSTLLCCLNLLTFVGVLLDSRFHYQLNMPSFINNINWAVSGLKCLIEWHLCHYYMIW